MSRTKKKNEFCQASKDDSLTIEEFFYHIRTCKICSSVKRAFGYEYWSNRPGNLNGGIPGRYTKTKTHKSERRIAKRELEKEVNEL